MKNSPPVGSNRSSKFSPFQSVIEESRFTSGYKIERENPPQDSNPHSRPGPGLTRQAMDQWVEHGTGLLRPVYLELEKTVMPGG